MPPPGSNTRRLRTAIVALTVATILAFGAWTLVGHRLTEHSSPPIATTANAGSTAPDQPPARADRIAGASKKIGIGHSVIAAPLPPPTAPLAQIYDELKARADTGEAQAASRLYRGLLRCRAVNEYRRHISRLLPSLLNADGRLHDVPLEQQDLALKRTQEWVTYVERNSDFCAGASDEQLASMNSAALQAANLGDLKALDCYVGTDFTSMSNLFEHPEVITQYRDNVSGLIDAAIGRGDWIALDLAQRAYSGESEGTPLGQLIAADPRMAYRYQRLERFGASGEFAGELDRQIAQTAGRLTPTQIVAADAWAQDHYSRYFNNSSSNEVANGVNICQIGDD